MRAKYQWELSVLCVLWNLEPTQKYFVNKYKWHLLTGLNKFSSKQVVNIVALMIPVLFGLIQNL